MNTESKICVYTGWAKSPYRNSQFIKAGKITKRKNGLRISIARSGKFFKLGKNITQKRVCRCDDVQMSMKKYPNSIKNDSKPFHIIPKTGDNTFLGINARQWSPIPGYVKQLHQQSFILPTQHPCSNA